MDNTINPRNQYLALLMSILSIIQPHQIFSLNKILFIQDRATRYSIAISSPALLQLKTRRYGSLKPKPLIYYFRFDSLDYCNNDYFFGKYYIN
jgi:hypothetical protein